MAEVDEKRTEYLNKLNDLSGKVNFQEGKLGEISQRIESLDGMLADLPARIARIRETGYLVLTHLERDQISLSNSWSNVGPVFKDRIRSRVENLRTESRDLKRRITRRQRNLASDHMRLRGVESRLLDFSSRVAELEDDVSSTLGSYNSRLKGLEEDLGIAESSIELTSTSSFKWREGESLIFVVEAEDMNNDTKGVVTLTNQRFIFESETEIVLKKTLFIATEKKKVREVVFEQPIGIIEHMHKGRVGFWAGHGVFVTFKPDSRLPEMKLDTKGEDADSMLRFFNFIISGDAEEELATLEKEVSEDSRESIPVICEVCGAPYNEEVYRGQISVQCNYCGAVIHISR